MRYTVIWHPAAESNGLDKECFGGLFAEVST